MPDNFLSIIMPVKNVENYIERCLNSLLNQTYNKFEIVILDDSDDNTPSVICSFNDDRIRYISYKGNISQKLNYGIKIAEHDLICRMDGDDFCDLNRFKKQIEVFKSDKYPVDVIGCNMIYVDCKGRQIINKKYPELHNDIAFYMPVFTSLPHATMFTLRRNIVNVGGYNEMCSGAEDLDLFLRMIDYGLKFYNLQDYLYYNTIIYDKFTISHSYNKLSYVIGNKYLEKTHKENPNFFHQKALLEYYKGNTNKSRYYFVKSFSNLEIKFFKFLRYYFVSLLGNRILKYLRNKQIATRVSFFVKRYFGVDTIFLKTK